MGIFADASYRMSRDMAAFARGELGYAPDEEERLAWRVLAGLRWWF